MKIYLDIDGTLIGADRKLAEGLHEFLGFVVANHDCYWLTTHCRSGVNRAIEALERAGVTDETLELARTIKPTDWDVLKTDAIDLNDEFVWFDDLPMASELFALKNSGKADSLYVIDLQQNTFALHDALAWLKRRS